MDLLQESLEGIKRCIERIEKHRTEYIGHIRLLNSHLETARSSSDDKNKAKIAEIIEPCVRQIKDAKAQIIALDSQMDALLETWKIRNPAGRSRDSGDSDSGVHSNEDTHRHARYFPKGDIDPIQESQIHDPDTKGQQHDERSDSEYKDEKE